MVDVHLIIAILVATLGAGTPLLFAALGELVSERAGVLNLGVEGMMLVGASVGFVVAANTDNFTLAVLAGMLAGAALALVFGVLSLSCMANQVATGLALTIFGIGVSTYIGTDYTGTSLPAPERAGIPELRDLPIVGPLLFSLETLTYLSFVLFVAVYWFIYRSRAGLILRAVGDAPDSAHAVGFSVIGVRYLAVLFGGAMAGVAGAFLSVFYTPTWIENMTAGRGWIAVALVVFSGWRPLHVMIGAYLFGGVTILQFHIQGTNLGIASQFLSMLPYLATIAVLVVISRDAMKLRVNAPASLGTPFHPES